MNDVPADALLGGRLSLRQLATGHRAGTDALLLAAASAPEPGSMAVDAGCGVGTVGLVLAWREPSLTVCLIEREAELAALAAANAAANGVADRVVVRTADLFDREALAGVDGDTVVSNPPFHLAGTVRTSPDPLKARAHGHETVGTGAVGHGDWLRAMLRLLRPHGRVVIIHRPDALPALLAAADGRLGALRIRPVLPRQGQTATRIMFGGIAGSRAPFSIADPLVVHEADGGFTPLVAAIARGEAAIPLRDTPTRKSRP